MLYFVLGCVFAYVLHRVGVGLCVGLCVGFCVGMGVGLCVLVCMLVCLCWNACWFACSDAYGLGVGELCIFDFLWRARSPRALRT